MKRLTLAAVLGTVFSTGSVVLADAPTVLELRGARIQMATLTPAATSAGLSNLAQRTDSRHAIVRLTAELDESGRAKMASEGVQLLSCLGPRTWIASIDPKVANRAEALVDRISWSGEIPRSAKLHPFLAAGRVPEWTIDRRDLDAFLEGRNADLDEVIDQIAQRDDPTVALYVLAHGDIDLADFSATLELGGAEIRSSMKTVNGLLVRVPMSRIEALVDLDETVWVEPALPALETNNASNRVNTQVDAVHQAPYELDGDGVVVMVYDGGYADASHADFGDRLTVRDSSGQSSHGTHVCGTVGGDGSASGGTHKGMAPAATIESYGFEQEGGLSEGFLYTDPGDLEVDYSDAINNWGAVVANNSIGTNTAPNGFPCEWTGDYGVTSSVIDSVVRGDLGGDIRIVWANGNERQSTRCGDLYNTTAPPACAKNHISVGATNSNDDSITTFTSWGPSDDGRIKPDISAPGCQSDDDGGVTSTVPGGGYSSYCGTSMASPTVTGIAALILQEWRNLHPGEPDLSNAALKALLANSGADFGHPGPDCQYGFGTVRAKNAIDSLRADGVIESQVGDGETTEHLIVVTAGEDSLRITLAWDDEPASPLPAAALVNDLDLLVTDPAGNVIDPWTIDPANPGLAATRSGRDRINNMEQVTVEAPMPGAWRVQIVGHAVPVGPQSYGLAADPNPIACSSTGVVGFSGQRVQPDTIVSITVVDCDLNTDDTVTDSIAVALSSDDAPLGFDTVLTEEDPASSTFTGSVQLTSSSTSPGLYALDGSEIRVVYLDESDASGNIDSERLATALIDGSITAPESVDVLDFGPDSATITINTGERVRVTILYGSSCDSLDQEVVSSSYLTEQSITISGLEDTFTYFFRIMITDQAGNTGIYGDGGDCFDFTVPDAIDFYAEQFGSGIDLVDSRITFTPIETADEYVPRFEPSPSLPFDPSGGSILALGDDDSQSVDIPFGFDFYGVEYNTAYVGSNGYLTFGSGDTGYDESFGSHFNLPRISMLFDDLNPSIGGTVSWKIVGDAFVVTWSGVSEYNTSNSNTFQISLFESGEMMLAWGSLDVGDAILGLSPGEGLASNFIPNDLSASEIGCLPRPPSVSNVSLATSPGTPVDIGLVGSDDGQPSPMFFVIDSLPVGVLRDLSTGIAITSVPHVIESEAGPHLQYQSPTGWEGVATFVYHADDGGSPPEGGPSNDAEVTIVVSSGPQALIAWDMDTNPGWSLEGAWSWGSPSGGGGDPNGGDTGVNVIGYALDAEYGNNLGEVHATSPSFDCTDATGTTLRFSRWLGVERSEYDHAYVRVSNDGGLSWSTIYENSNTTFEDTSWTVEEFDLSAIADGESDVRIRFTMGTTDGSVTFCGWNIDDVVVEATLPGGGSAADLNGDGVVNGADVGLLLAEWGPCSGCPADLNGDGLVNGADFGLLLADWGGDGFNRQAAPDQESDIDVDGDVADSILVKDRTLQVPDGLLVIDGAYVQDSKMTLSLAIDGDEPVTDHDLVVVRGEASLRGRLEVKIGNPPESGDFIAVVLLADSIIGDFEEIEVIGGRRVVDVCTTANAVVVMVGDEARRSSLTEFPAIPDEVIMLIDSIGSTDPVWDLDHDGVVTEADLRILLRAGIDCR